MNYECAISGRKSFSSGKLEVGAGHYASQPCSFAQQCHCEEWLLCAYRVGQDAAAALAVAACRRCRLPYVIYVHTVRTHALVNGTADVASDCL